MFRSSSPLHTLKDHLEWAARAFERAGLYYGHGTDNAADDSFQLALHALQWTPARAAKNLGRRLTPGQKARLRTLIRRRVRTRMPSAYLTGEAWFAGLRFRVTPQVLIPRSPIAELIESRFRPWLSQTPRDILDLCSGSGCIGIACAKILPSTRVDLVELDPEAAAICADNVRRHRLQRRVQVLRSDLFDALDERRYDLIVTNPPYVPLAEWKRMPDEYHHEPRLALEAGRDGMKLVARILDQAADHLTPGGHLICEIGGSLSQFLRRFPRFPALWPEFERGGDGVFIIRREELIRWKESTRVR